MHHLHFPLTIPGGYYSRDYARWADVSVRTITWFHPRGGNSESNPTLLLHRCAPAPRIHAEVGRYRLRLAQTLKIAKPPAACVSRSSISRWAKGLKALTRPDSIPISSTYSANICWSKIKRTRRIVGTYRMQSGETAAANLGYYSEQEFHFAPYEPLRAGILELGRASIDREHRTPEVLTLLWRGIAQYATDMGLRYLVGCSSLNSQDPCEGWQMYRQLEHYRVSPEFATEPTAAYACPTEQEGAHAQPSPGTPMHPLPRSPQGSQAAPNLSGHRRAHLCSAGLGPRVRHHRFPYAARSQVAFAFRAQSLSGSAHSLSLRAARRAVALGFALIVCVLRYWLFRLRGRLRWSGARFGCSLPAATVLASLGIHVSVRRRAAAGRRWSCRTTSAISISPSSRQPCRVSLSPRRRSADGPTSAKRARSGGTMFIDRSSRRAPTRWRAEIAERLPLPIPILFFPEGHEHRRQFGPALSLAPL